MNRLRYLTRDELLEIVRADGPYRDGAITELCRRDDKAWEAQAEHEAQQAANDSDDYYADRAEARWQAGRP